MKYIILTLAFAATQAMATQRCEPKTPDIKTPEVKAAAKAPEPRQSRSEPDHDRPCDQQTMKPFWCPRVK